MSNIAIRLDFEDLRSLAFGSISGTYMGVGSAIDHPARMILVQNMTDAALMFSWNGVDDHFPLASNSFLLLDITSNKTILHGGFFIAEGSRLYVKEIGNPTSGSVYFTVMFGAE